jgi:hypothetical protein
MAMPRCIRLSISLWNLLERMYVWSAVCSDALEFVLWRSAKKCPARLARSESSPAAHVFRIIARRYSGGRLAAVEAAVLVSLCTR